MTENGIEIFRRCETCGKILEKKDNMSKKYFKERKYCSLKCRPSDYRNNPRTGENHHMWKGGRYKHSDGYWYILKKDYTSSNKQGYILEHRYIMEQHIGRLLTSKECVHHINEDKSDNRIENLRLCIKGHNHKQHHRGMKYKNTKIRLAAGKKLCGICKQEKPFSEFHKHKNKPDGYHWECKMCNKLQRIKRVDL